MAISFFQKLRLKLRARERHREEREKEFLARNVSWAAPKPVAGPAARTPVSSIDREGLQVAFLDDSGAIAYYLDTVSGEVVEQRDGEASPDATRCKRVPRRNLESDSADRQKFVASLKPSAIRDRLAAAPDAAAFRRILSTDRALERTWYVYKNDAATAAIEAWLKEIGVSRG